MAVSAYGGLLHTNSEYAGDINYAYTKSDKDEAKFNQKVSYLQANEQQFYSLFGVSDYGGFKAKVQQLFSNQNDVQFMRSFENHLLRTESSFFSFFSQKRGQLDFQGSKVSEYQVVLKADKVPDLKIKGFQLKDAQMKDLIIPLQISGRSSTFKKELESRFQAVPDKNNNTRTLKKSDQRDILKQISTMNINEHFYVTKQGEGESVNNFPSFLINVDANASLGFSKGEIERIMKNPNTEEYQVFMKLIQTSFKQLKEYIFGQLISQAGGISNEMRQATKIVWDSLANNEPTNLVQYFSGGGNYVRVFLGAMGEFQSAVMFNFLKLKGNINNENIARITGQDMINGVQPKQDVVLEWAAQVGQRAGFGVQVKNYNRNLNSIGTSMNLAAEMERLDVSEDLITFLTNYFFNSDFQSDRDLDQVTKFFADQVVELYNLATSTQLDQDKITFYHISSSTLIPASVIAMAARTIAKIPLETKITSSYTSHSDEEFSSGDEPLYLQYWENMGAGNWVPKREAMMSTQKNICSCTNIYGGFDYSSLIEQYSLFS